MLRFNAKRAILWRVAVFRRCVSSFWNRVLACWMGKSVNYRQLQTPVVPPSLTSKSVSDTHPTKEPPTPRRSEVGRDSSDLVALKISLLGDCQIGKTSFLVSIYLFWLRVDTYYYCYNEKRMMLRNFATLEIHIYVDNVTWNI